MMVLPAESVTPKAGDRALCLAPSTVVLTGSPHTFLIMLSC